MTIGTKATVRIAAPWVRFAEWLFGPLSPEIDLLLLLFAGGWAALSVVHPIGFQSGAWAGVNWLPNVAWLCFRLLIVVLCLLGLLHPFWRTVRVAAAFLSSWHWLVVSFSIARVEISPSVPAYFILGFWSLLAGIYLAGLPRGT